MRGEGIPPGTVTRIEALRYRSLRYVSVPLRPFQVLVGPNASGKSSFLDVVAFLGDLLRAGLPAAIEGDLPLGIPFRAADAKHLVWMRGQDRFELAVEVSTPTQASAGLKNGPFDTCRYEVAIDVAKSPRIVAETLWLKRRLQEPPRQASLFPDVPEPPRTLVHVPRQRAPRGWKKVVSRGEEPERVMFYSETSGWNNPFRIKADKVALASLPEDEERFPVATWFRKLLTEGVRRLVLSAEQMRRPSPPTRTQGYMPDGSNLPHVVQALASEHPERYEGWIAHVREALPDLESVTTHEREEDRHRYLVLRFKSGLEAPSWLVSDGTLRLLALTLLAYLADLTGIYLIEEPENGIHPRALEISFQSLSSVYGAQVLLATHSPLIVRMADAADILCFSRNNAVGATAVVPGNHHPRLEEWKGVPDMGTLLAAGVLS